MEQRPILAFHLGAGGNNDPAACVTEFDELLCDVRMLAFEESYQPVEKPA